MCDWMCKILIITITIHVFRKFICIAQIYKWVWSNALYMYNIIRLPNYLLSLDYYIFCNNYDINFLSLLIRR
jgi:predicted CDP-diglyceride synthetase/phosphatidate cytidylyltransferase